jgi:hypothetical protein
VAETYKIESQRPITSPDASGTFVPAMEITFTTKPSGVPGRVLVPNSQYTPANVDKAVDAAARNIEAVHNL